MSVTESERHQLFSWFEEHMGQERAATMMNLVPPVGWAEVATRHDLDELDSRLTTRIDALESKLDGRFEALESRFDALESKFEYRFEAIGYRFDATDAKFESLEHRIDAKLEAMRSELMRTFGTWLFASQAAVIAAIGVMIALVALG
jgi:hypothetical protein